MSSHNAGSEVVVITGASAGVGRATARAFARRGARIGLLARGEDGLEGARADVEKEGGEALVIPNRGRSQPGRRGCRRSCREKVRAH